MFLIATAMLVGCRMSAPIHVWQPPRLVSAVDKRVVLSPLVGPEEIAEPLQQQLLSTVPKDNGRKLQLIDGSRLKSFGAIQLVSASSDEPNDVVLASVARRQGADFLLRGELVDRAQRTKKPQDASIEALAISWRLTPLDQQSPAKGRPVSVDLETAIDRYPDLRLQSDPQLILTAAIARESFRLFSPFVEQMRVQLSIPYGFPGSRQVRRGNLAARAGNWGQAQRIWRSVLEEHPRCVAAIHNLALAAAAGQDFSEAKRLARRAIRLQPTSLHQESLVWIELQQRAYHQAFHLPPPPEGWFVTTQAMDESSALSRPE